jgi:hypothetical protein
VFAINLSHTIGRLLIRKWHTAFMTIDEETLSNMSWGGGNNDQDLLHEILRENESTLRTFIHLENAELMNSLDARFIRQMLRSNESDMTTRVERLRSAARRVLATASDQEVQDLTTEDDLIMAVYRSILKRDPDRGGKSHYRDLLKAEGLRSGVGTMIRSILSSPERIAVEKRESGRS